MHMTLEADYAVRIVHCLAVDGGRVDAKRIADETGVTLRFSLKILRRLVAGGLVVSYKGAKGGYQLARPPEEITLCDVIEEVEGPYALSRCISQHDYQCNRNRDRCGHCHFSTIYREISQMVRQQLQQVDFGQLSQPVDAGEPSSQ